MALLRDGHVVKAYSTETGDVYFSEIDEFLQRVSKEPGLVQDTPVTVRVLTDGEWIGSIDDKYEAQSNSGNGTATLTLTQPALPVETCFRNPNNSPSVPITIEIYTKYVAEEIRYKRYEGRKLCDNSAIKSLIFLLQLSMQQRVIPQFKKHYGFCYLERHITSLKKYQIFFKPAHGFPFLSSANSRQANRTIKGRRRIQ